MKKLNKEEAAALGIVKHGNSSSVRVQLMQLEIGEGLIIFKETDWKYKHPPYRVINYLAKQTGRKFTAGASADGKGWNVIRLS